MFRYYAANSKGQEQGPGFAFHTNFLRTGRIVRRAEDWVEEERRYLTDEEVAERTGKRLESAGRKTHQRLNAFHRKIRFPEIIFHKTLASAPHLGYVHVTASKADIAEHRNVAWGFYIANFSAEINGGEHFFSQVSPDYGRMYFAVAMKPGEAAEPGTAPRPVVNREIGDNGVIFRTSDPKAALKNVLMLGARNAELKKIVEAIG